MKRTIGSVIILLSVFYLLPYNNYAQRALVTSNINSNTFKQQAIEKGNVVDFIERKSKTGSVNIFQFDSTVLKDSIFTLTVFNNEPLRVMIDGMDKRSENDFSLYGHIQGSTGKEGSIVFTYLNGELSGNLNYKFKNYAIHPLGKAKIAVYEIDFKQYPEDDAQSLINRDKKINKNSSPENSQTTSTLIVAPMCRIRILVAYTARAEDSVKNRFGYSTMVQFINQAIAETNQSYINSQVNYMVELATSIRVNYTESGSYDTDLDRFQSTNDGYMDEINAYRNAYSADVCVLVFDNNSSCGLASTIQADASSAFCVVHVGCVLGNYSFGHEIGHLFGCRHNTEADDNTEPFAYGHGYVYQPGKWRTIMAYDINKETRLQFFSNPNVLYNKIAMGTPDINNNARVLNENAGAVGAFRPTEAVVTLYSTNSIINDETGDVTATTTIFLEPGFQVLTNSVFDAHIKNCNNLADSRLNSIAANNLKENLEADKTSLSIYPNPADKKIDVRYQLKYDADIAFTMYNMQGILVYQSASAKKLAGIFHETINVSKFAAGVYLLKCLTNNKIISTTKIVIAH
jgi:hypothetical protein